MDAAIEEGRYRDAWSLASAELGSMDTCAAAALEAGLALERRDWASAMRVNPEACMGELNGVPWYARGMAGARATGRSENLAALPAAREALTRLDAIAREAGPFSEAELRRVAVAAAIAASQDERDELRVLLTHAVGLADRWSRRCGAVIHELAGDLWLQVDRFVDARASYNAALVGASKMARSRAGFARAAARLGDRSAAEAAYRAFLEQWRKADADRPEVQEARKYLDNQ
jgi:hypothetical protein